jgi:imidazolonepropionase-like amidohydrolase
MPAKEDHAVMIANGKIQFIGPEESAQIPPGAQRMGRSGYTVIPGVSPATARSRSASLSAWCAQR